jgi:hypothetical protein
MTARRRKPGYSESVFINCPFDVEYRPLFRALVFTLEACGFAPRCALEVDDGGEPRADKIIRLIRSSRLGIHDISRTEVNQELLPRFNMAYELGLFVGLRNSDDRRQRKKVALILDREPHRYQKYLSDIAGQDIRSHGSRPHELIRQVRHWLQAQCGRNLFGADRLIADFDRFTAAIPRLVQELDKSEADLSNFHDFHRLISDWVDMQYNRSTDTE